MFGSATFSSALLAELVRELRRSRPPGRPCASRCPRCRRSGRRARASGRCAWARARRPPRRPSGCRSGRGRRARACRPPTSSKQAWPRKRMSISVSFGFCGSSKLAGKFPANGHTNHHAQPGLLREEGLDPGGSRGLVGLGHRGAHLRLVCGPEPAALFERMHEHSMKLRRGSRHEPLGVGEPLGIGQRANRGVQLFVGERQALRVSRGSSRPITDPASAPPTAAPMFASLGREREQHQHRGDHVRADQVVLAVVAAARRAGGRPRARRRAARAPRRWRRRPTTPGRPSAAAASRASPRAPRPRRPPARTSGPPAPSRSGARGACRRSRRRSAPRTGSRACPRGRTGSTNQRQTSSVDRAGMASDTPR